MIATCTSSPTVHGGSGGSGNDAPLRVLTPSAERSTRLGRVRARPRGTESTESPRTEKVPRICHHLLLRDPHEIDEPPRALLCLREVEVSLKDADHVFPEPVAHDEGREKVLHPV